MCVCVSCVQLMVEAGRGYQFPLNWRSNYGPPDIDTGLRHRCWAQSSAKARSSKGTIAQQSPQTETLTPNSPENTGGGAAGTGSKYSL